MSPHPVQDSDSLQLKADFSERLQEFLLQLDRADWRRVAPSCLFFRDFEQLPQRAPFDLDLLCARAEWPALADHIRLLSEQTGLLAFVHSVAKATYVLLLDLAGEASRRRHCFFEIRESLDIPAAQFAIPPTTGRLRIASGDVVRMEAAGLPVPAPAWHCAFLILQALRKPRPDRYLAAVQIMSATIRDDAVALLAELGFDRAQLTAWLAAPRPVARPARQAAEITWRQRAAAFSTRYLFFLPLLNHEFFSLHGPDGVGKTTTCLEIEKLFAGLPMGLYMFHHSEGWKGARRRPEAAAAASGGRSTVDRAAGRSVAEPGLLHRILRVIYRGMPEWAKDLWVWNSHFIVYNRKFSQFLLRNRGHGEILFSDRYLYDVRIKYMVETEKPKLLVCIYYRLHCDLLSRPKHSFILTDDPAAIARRKDELSENQIRRFLGGIREALRQHGVPAEEIGIDGRPPRAVALDITTRLLRRIDASVIDYVKAYMNQLEARGERS